MLPKCFVEDKSEAQLEEGRTSVLASPDFVWLREKFGLARTLAFPMSGVKQHARSEVPSHRPPDLVPSFDAFVEYP